MSKTNLDFLLQPKSNRSRRSMISKVWFSKARSAKSSCLFERMRGPWIRRFELNCGRRSALNITSAKACSTGFTGTWLIRWEINFAGSLTWWLTHSFGNRCSEQQNCQRSPSCCRRLSIQLIVWHITWRRKAEPLLTVWWACWAMNAPTSLTARLSIPSPLFFYISCRVSRRKEFST